jgi:hypothetical protein
MGKSSTKVQRSFLKCSASGDRERKKLKVECMLDSIMRIIWGFIKLYLYNLFLFMNINGESSLLSVLLTADTFFSVNLSLVGVLLM